jgi:hypothetical protein
MPANGEKVACAVCNRVVAGRIPARGDGSALYPARHKATERLKGSMAPRRYQAPTSWCPGTRIAGDKP